MDQTSAKAGSEYSFVKGQAARKTGERKKNIRSSKRGSSGPARGLYGKDRREMQNKERAGKPGRETPAGRKGSKVLL